MNSRVASLIIVVLLPVALLAGACAGQSPAEPAASSVQPTPAALSGNALPVQNDENSLPTAGPTPAAPETPTPLAISQNASETPVIEATRTAAANPPTPIILPSPTSSLLFTELMPIPAGPYSWTLKVPILMYHYVSEPPIGSDIYRVDLSVSPAAFRSQLTYLKENGYSTVDLYDLSAAIVNHLELPEKPVVLTFDDGYLDNYETAFPLLEEFGFKGTFFVVSEFVDSQREGYMTWPMIEEMARAGHRIESHSRTHPDLAGKSREALIWEILGSRDTIEAHSGYRPRYFCYPGGTYDEATIQMLRELDFWGAVTTENGSWHGFDDRYEWRRIRVRNSTNMDVFAELVDLEGTIRGKPPE